MKEAALKDQILDSPEVIVLIEQYEPEIQKLIHAARRTLRDAFPGAVETSDPSARLLGYSYGPGYKGTVATLLLSKTGVKIGIPYGSSLADPSHLLAGEGKVHRHVPIKRADELKTPGLRLLLKNALSASQMRTGRQA